uniref:Uncharacterized protein n=1 Tax=Percolomonas cosmopolitus TaxID=63605 RepID=A0A7S1KNV6_9EUKA|mmetsp:Transcript_2690/g.10326  ORF Transcript_2690/g.10326 Transcript_2690/m.10326 type:complete len:1194 (+) Transcript_2690:1705-5286(+)
MSSDLELSLTSILKSSKFFSQQFLHWTSSSGTCFCSSATVYKRIIVPVVTLEKSLVYLIHRDDSVEKRAFNVNQIEPHLEELLCTSRVVFYEPSNKTESYCVPRNVSRLTPGGASNRVVFSCEATIVDHALERDSAFGQLNLAASHSSQSKSFQISFTRQHSQHASVSVSLDHIRVCLVERHKTVSLVYENHGITALCVVRIQQLHAVETLLDAFRSIGFTNYQIMPPGEMTCVHPHSLLHYDFEHILESDIWASISIIPGAGNLNHRLYLSVTSILSNHFQSSTLYFSSLVKHKQKLKRTSRLLLLVTDVFVLLFKVKFHKESELDKTTLHLRLKYYDYIASLVDVSWKHTKHSKDSTKIQLTTTNFQITVHVADFERLQALGHVLEYIRGITLLRDTHFKSQLNVEEAFAPSKESLVRTACALSQCLVHHVDSGASHSEGEFWNSLHSLLILNHQVQSLLSGGTSHLVEILQQFMLFCAAWIHNHRLVRQLDCSTNECFSVLYEKILFESFLSPNQMKQLMTKLAEKLRNTSEHVNTPFATLLARFPQLHASYLAQAIAQPTRVHCQRTKDLSVSLLSSREVVPTNSPPNNDSFIRPSSLPLFAHHILDLKQICSIHDNLEELSSFVAWTLQNLPSVESGKSLCGKIQGELSLFLDNYSKELSERLIHLKRVCAHDFFLVDSLCGFEGAMLIHLHDSQISSDQDSVGAFSHEQSDCKEFSEAPVEEDNSTDASSPHIKVNEAPQATASNSNNSEMAHHAKKNSSCSPSPVVGKIGSPKMDVKQSLRNFEEVLSPDHILSERASPRVVERDKEQHFPAGSVLTDDLSSIASMKDTVHPLVKDLRKTIIALEESISTSTSTAHQKLVVNHTNPHGKDLVTVLCAIVRACWKTTADSQNWLQSLYNSQSSCFVLFSLIREFTELVLTVADYADESQKERAFIAYLLDSEGFGIFFRQIFQHETLLLTPSSFLSDTNSTTFHTFCDCVFDVLPRFHFAYREEKMEEKPLKVLRDTAVSLAIIFKRHYEEHSGWDQDMMPHSTIERVLSTLIRVLDYMLRTGLKRSNLLTAASTWTHIVKCFSHDLELILTASSECESTNSPHDKPLALLDYIFLKRLVEVEQQHVNHTDDEKLVIRLLTRASMGGALKELVEFVTGSGDDFKSNAMIMAQRELILEILAALRWLPLSMVEFKWQQ